MGSDYLIGATIRSRGSKREREKEGERERGREKEGNKKLCLNYNIFGIIIQMTNTNSIHVADG